LDRTLDAVEKQLSPSQLVDQTMGYLREHGGDMTQSIGRSVKENPFPLVLTGIGLAWLMASQSSNRSAQSDRHSNYYRDRLVTGYDNPYRSADFQHLGSNGTAAPSGEAQVSASTEHNGIGGHNGDSLRKNVKDKIDQWGDRAAEARHSMGQQVQSMKQGADETVEQWQERTEATLNDLQQSAFDTGRDMQARSKEVGDWFQEQPLVTGALGIAVGALVGSLIPSTRLENKLVGETADSVKIKVAEDITSKATDLSEQVEDVAGQLETKVKNQADEFINESTAV